MSTVKDDGDGNIRIEKDEGSVIVDAYLGKDELIMSAYGEEGSAVSLSVDEAKALFTSLGDWLMTKGVDIGEIWV